MTLVLYLESIKHRSFKSFLSPAAPQHCKYQHFRRSKLLETIQKDSTFVVCPVFATCLAAGIFLVNIYIYIYIYIYINIYIYIHL